MPAFFLQVIPAPEGLNIHIDTLGLYRFPYGINPLFLRNACLFGQDAYHNDINSLDAAGGSGQLRAGTATTFLYSAFILSMIFSGCFAFPVINGMDHLFGC